MPNSEHLSLKELKLLAMTGPTYKILMSLNLATLKNSKENESSILEFIFIHSFTYSFSKK